MGVHLLQTCCLVVGELFLSTQLSGLLSLNGKVKVMLTKVCSLSIVPSRGDLREGAYLGGIIRAVLSWDPCVRGLSGCSPDGSRVAMGSGWDRGRVGPCSMSAQMLNQGPGLVLAPDNTAPVRGVGYLVAY